MMVAGMDMLGRASISGQRWGVEVELSPLRFCAGARFDGPLRSAGMR